MLSKTEAVYVPHPQNGQRCSECAMFLPPHACTLVKGEILPAGRCKWWEPKTTVAKDGPLAADVHVATALGNISTGVGKPKKKKRKEIAGGRATDSFRAVGSPSPVDPSAASSQKRYSSTKDLPDAVKNRIKGKKRKQWLAVWNSSFDRHHDENRAFAEAWAVAKNKNVTAAELAILLVLDKEQVLKSFDALTAAPMVGVGGRTLQPFDDGTLFVPFKYDPSALAYLRRDQVPRFLDAVTHPKRLDKADVALSALTAIKGRVSREVVQKHLDNIGDGLKCPVVVAMNGEIYIADGHDRLAAMWLNGDDTAEVRFDDISDYDNRKPDSNVDHEGSRFDLLHGVDNRTLACYHDNTLQVPFRYDPAFFAHLRPDQVPKFLYAITHADDLPEATVSLEGLIAIQDRINADTVAAKVEDPSKKLPVVVRLEGGRNYLADGHDRLSANWLMGDDQAKVRLQDLSGPVTNTMKSSFAIVVAKVDQEKGQIFGWASTATIGGQIVTDKQLDQIEPHEMEAAAYDYVVNSRLMGDMHVNKNAGHLIESMVFTKQKQNSLGIDLGKEAWWVGFQVTDSKTLEAIREGQRPELSVGGFAIPVEV